MRLARLTWLAYLPLFSCLVGCMGEGTTRARLFDGLPFLDTKPASESAYLEYVLIDRPAGRDDINRRVWDRVDEQVLNADIRSTLEDNGLRIGTISETMPGILRGMVDDPRTNRGHRFRSFQADKSVALYITPVNKPIDFTMPNGEREPIKFQRDQALLGFEISVKELPDHKVHVKLVPMTKYHDANLFVPQQGELREQATELFPAGTIELTVPQGEYIVIGTEFYKDKTFGKMAFVGESATLERTAQRVLVLRAGLNKADRVAPQLLNGKDDPTGTLPIASQASLARGQKP